MIVYLNGRFVPEEQASVSIHDRGLIYGDGLFETIRVYDSEPFLWAEHMERLHAGCEALRIRSPLSPNELKAAVARLIIYNRGHDSIIRIALTRGVGARGYSPRGADHPTLAITLSPLTKHPGSYKVITSSFRLPANDLLAAFKHSNKLRQVLARAEADEQDANEALLLNDRDEVIEGTSSNVFWIDGEILCTPPTEGILPGTTRKYLLQRAQALGIRTKQTKIKLAEILKAKGAFVTSTGLEVMEISHINGTAISSSPITRRLQLEYRPRK